MFPGVLKRLYEAAEITWRQSGLIAGKSGRHMKFPYTISAKIAQFPLFFYMQNNNIWMYYPIGVTVAFWVFYKIHVLANSDVNKRAWAETQRKNAEKEHHH